ncbi:MAG: four helix bundle protein [Acidobacteriia bacterium]|nr:four helix bundle protein [Terriglobia bacterium]
MANPTIELKSRTKKFALNIIRLFRSPPRAEDVRIIARQVLRSGTSVAANYRAACRARSRAEFIAKLGTVVEEADETVFWLELLVESGMAQQQLVAAIAKEANELLAIFAASQRTTRQGVKDWVTESVNH